MTTCKDCGCTETSYQPFYGPAAPFCECCECCEDESSGCPTRGNRILPDVHFTITMDPVGPARFGKVIIGGPKLPDMSWDPSFGNFGSLNGIATYIRMRFPSVTHAIVLWPNLTDILIQVHSVVGASPNQLEQIRIAVQQHAVPTGILVTVKTLP